MGLQEMVRWILPKEEVFYSLIERQVELLEQAALALAKFADGEPAERVHETIQEIEHQADALVYESEEHFAKVFVTPIDREDIQLLVVSLDDIVDLINLTGRTFVLFNVPKPTPPMVELMRLIVKMAGVLKNEIGALRRHEYAKLIQTGRTLKQLEKEGDQTFRQAVGALFHDPAVDAKVLLRDKEILEDLENAIDKFETVAERLKNLAVKHG